jgi:hypothetical protein
MMNYPRALQFSIVFLFTASTVACSGGSGGSAYQDVSGEGNGGSGDGGANQTGVTVTITNPGAPEIDTTDHSMDLKGSAQSQSGITAVSWETNRGSEGSANGTESWTISDIPLELGANKITVTATDASGRSQSDTIIINRESGGTGSVTLSWLPPTERTDGTPLDNLAGYKISFGRMSKVYDYTVTIDNPGLATYVVENLKPGSWYFAITAYDTEGLESEFSNEARLGVD